MLLKSTYHVQTQLNSNSRENIVPCSTKNIGCINGVDTFLCSFLRESATTSFVLMIFTIYYPPFIKKKLVVGIQAEGRSNTIELGRQPHH